MVPLQSLEARTLSAELRGDEETWRRLHALDDGEGSLWAEVMPTALVLAAVRRFGRGDLRLITVFVRKFLARRGDDVFPAASVEAVLRGVLGEDLLFRSVEPAEAGDIMYALLFALVDDLDLDDEQADGLLAAVEKQLEVDRRAFGVPPEGPPDAPVLPDVMHRRTRKPYLSSDDLVPSPEADGIPAPRRSRRGTRNAVPSTLAGRFIRAAMLRKSEERRHLSSVLKDLGTDDATILTRATFVVAVRRHFSPSVHLREISDLAAAAQAAFYPALNLMATEFMVRAALGEVVPDPGLSVHDEILARTLVLGTFADWWERDEAVVGSVIARAEADVAEAGGSLAREDRKRGER
ncbi:hypothetical protein AFR_26000 [Actinoplanes friuliensis DSM 7358]|uniref:Uncharacterized protein n=2 Tax=Actinoplanes friuliensis TaxID=196914 RepID=U5W2V7_9ACTN|nr:hypothetical protein AFR_26000 [Actinoplanes friuliensis DSM 7358]